MNTPAQQIPLDRIIVEDRLRAIDPDHAALIAESFRANGQMTPIEVRPGADGRFVLVAGAHRIEAASIAGMPTIAAVVIEASDDQARLREIDENLCRRDLSELDRAVFLAQRKKVWERLHPDTKNGGDRRGKQNDKFVVLFPAFTAEVSEKLGVSRRTVERAIRRHDRLAPDVRMMLATTRFAERGSELDALCKEDAATQRRIVKRLLAEKDPAPTVAAAKAALRIGAAAAPDPVELQFAALKRAWEKAGTKARRQFVDMLVERGDLEPLKAVA